VVVKLYSTGYTELVLFVCVCVCVCVCMCVCVCVCVCDRQPVCSAHPVNSVWRYQILNIPAQEATRRAHNSLCTGEGTELRQHVSVGAPAFLKRWTLLSLADEVIKEVRIIQGDRKVLFWFLFCHTLVFCSHSRQWRIVRSFSANCKWNCYSQFCI